MAAAVALQHDERPVTPGPADQETKPMPRRSRTYGTVSADRQKAMSGLEFVQGLVDGTLPLNTIAEILAYDVTEVERGRVAITCEPNGSHLNPAGTVHGGLSATLLDSCMGLAIRSMQEKGVSSTTLEFQDLARAPNHPGIRLDQSRGCCAELRPPHRDGRRAHYRSAGQVAGSRNDDLLGL